MPQNQQLPKRKGRKLQRLVVMNPSKGLNNLVSPLLIDNREMSDMLNMEFDEGGVLRKRSGYTAVGSVLTAAKGLGTFVTESVNYCVTIDGTSLKYLNGSAWTVVSGASFTSGQEVVFSQARGKLYIWNGVDGGASWDGTTLTRPGTMPKGKFGIMYQDKQIVSGVAGQPNRVYISQTDDASAFTRAATLLNNSTEVPGATVFAGTTANFIDVRKDDGDIITGLGRFLDTIIVFKKKSIYQLTFDSSGPIITPITAATGCLSHKSICNVENDVFFLSREGIRTLGNAPNFFTAIRTNILSIKIQPTITAVNNANIAKANSIFINNEYILACPTTTSTVDTCIVFDKRFGAWTKWDTINPNAMIQYIDSNNAPHFYFLNDTGTQMYEIVAGTYNDAGVAINAYLISKAQDFGNPDITKRFVDLTLMFRTISGLVTAQIYTDNSISAGSVVIGSLTADGNGRSALGTLTFGTGTGANSTTTATTDIAERIKIGQNSRTLKFKVSNARLNESFTFLGYTFGYYPYSPFFFDSTYTIYI